ncbi:hypothetical protein PCAR4_570068 [Paraburkholderia caribensis]|nr:hypothetical protein PCAR4_570068 [Paraburkholderia caribensis]
MLATFSQTDASRVSIEQGETDTALQVANGLADCGRSDAKPDGRRRKALFLRDGNEGSDSIQVILFHVRAAPELTLNVPLLRIEIKGLWYQPPDPKWRRLHSVGRWIIASSHGAAAMTRGGNVSLAAAGDCQLANVQCLSLASYTLYQAILPSGSCRRDPPT